MVIKQGNHCSIDETAHWAKLSGKSVLAAMEMKAVIETAEYYKREKCHSKTQINRFDVPTDKKNIYLFKCTQLKTVDAVKLTICKSRTGRYYEYCITAYR